MTAVAAATDAADATARAPCIFVSAGEPSGDRIGAAFLRACKRLAPGTTFVGIGGDHMKAEGLDPITDLTKTSGMWLTRSLAMIPRLYGVLQEVRRVLDERKPDAVVVIDYPGFHFYLSWEAKRRGIPSIYYVTPQLWAYNPYRAVKMRKIIDQALVVLPFEEPFFRERDVAADYVGHPLMERWQEEWGDETPPPVEEPVLGLLPGSRKQEIITSFPHMIDAVRRLRETEPALRVVVSAGQPAFRPLIEEPLKATGVPFELLEGMAGEIFRRSRSCMVTSGTTSLEGVFHLTPLVVLYRIPAFSYWVAQPWRLLDHIALPNILAGKEIVPEFLLWRAGDSRPVVAAEKVFTDAAEREAMRGRLSEVRAKMLERPHPSETAARAVLEKVRSHRSPD